MNHPEKIKIVTIIGARPQIIKAAALSRTVKDKYAHQITEIIVHTGQHYDEKMSAIFFQELEIPLPDYNLQVGSASHGTQTARMTEGIEDILLKEKPQYIVLYGDTNSTLAGAIAAAKIHIPIVHIEAGLRSFNKSMPEEINRILCDHCSTLLFSPTETGYNNLIQEGFHINQSKPYTVDQPGVFHCGDVMYDNSRFFAQKANESKFDFLASKALFPNDFILCTIHRNNNTDEAHRLKAIFEALHHIATNSRQKIFLPLHPRTSKLLQQSIDSDLYNKITTHPQIFIEEPVSFLEMILLEQHASMIITDSGGVQKEAYYFNKPSIILRPQTEWTEIVSAGAAILADASKEKILEAWEHFTKNPPIDFPAIFGDGRAAEFILSTMIQNCKANP